MLKELLNQKVKVGISYHRFSVTGKGYLKIKEGIITDMDDNFIKFDDGMIISIKAITYILPL